MLEPPEEELPPFTGTVLDCLDEPLTDGAGPHPDVRLALALTRIPLADAGLLGYPRLGANRAARRRVEFLRERHAAAGRARAGRRGQRRSPSPCTARPRCAC
ncbi:hypothetical protein SFUMM280S_08788 [Streptomyces fumanus]